MKKERRTEVFKIVAVLLTGLLFGIMVAMMDAGGGVTFADFLQAGDVYDFSQRALVYSNEKWVYSAEKQVYEIIAPKATKRFIIDKKENEWHDLYVNVKKMNVPQLDAELRCYDSEKNRIFEQPITLVQGMNHIELLAELPFCEIGFHVKDAEGLCISFDSMQIREKATAYEPMRFWLVFSAAYAGFLLVCLAAGVCIKRSRGSLQRKEGDKKILPGKELTYVYFHMDHIVGVRRKKVRSLYGRTFWQRLIFCLLFFWCIAMNVLGWKTDGDLYRYDLLGLAVLFLVEGLLCGRVDGTRKKVFWNSPSAYAWMGLWIGTIISDFFTATEVHFQGYVMIFAVGFFIYRWNRMRNPDKVLGIMAEALEIDFGLSILFCLFFRPKRLAVAYNGIFRNPEDNAMFALLMVLVLVIEIERMILAPRKEKRMIVCAAELALAVYMVLRAENRAGYAALAIVLAVFLWRIIGYHRQLGRWIKQNGGIFALSILLSCGALAGFHVGIKYIPEHIGLVWEYDDEEKMSMESEQILDELTAYDPALTEGVVRADEVETAVIRQNYIRHWNLLGNGNEVRVFRQKTPAYNGYVYMAYRYGIFILVPFILYQIAVLWSGAGCLRRDRKKVGHALEGQKSFLLFGTATICIVFCLSGNAEVSLENPLLICMYAVTGCRFEERQQKKTE